MVRRGSTVRVRQRALQKRRKSALVRSDGLAPEHDMTNVGESPLRVLGTFASSTVVATFEEPLAPDGPQVFVIGGRIPNMLPLAAAPA
jgi:hypothetical protein